VRTPARRWAVPATAWEVDMTALRQQMIDDLVLRGLSAKTQEAYLRTVTQLAAFYGRAPHRISEREIQAYLLHLYREKGFSHSTCNVAVAGLRFFYHVTLQRQSTSFVIPAAREPLKLPEILTRDELTRLFSLTRRPKHRALLLTTYAAGLRASEAVALQLRDLDGERGVIRVRQGKGARDRTTLLSPYLLEALREYWRQERPDRWLFPSRHERGHLCAGAAKHLYAKAKQRAGIEKPGGLHTLRHTFATHLLEAGVGLHTLQRLLGHKSLRSTAHYLHLARPVEEAAKTVPEPLDFLPR
jgi:site-specific recombinase XerD